MGSKRYRTISAQSSPIDLEGTIAWGATTPSGGWRPGAQDVGVDKPNQFY